MLLRSIAHLLVIVMLIASGRLLACGLDCLDQLAVPAEASCHQESAPDTALNGEIAHACLPDVVETRVTAAKPATAQALLAAPLAAVFTTHAASSASFDPGRHAILVQVAPPHSPAPSVLRV